MTVISIIEIVGMCRCHLNLDCIITYHGSHYCFLNARATETAVSFIMKYPTARRRKSKEDRRRKFPVEQIFK